MTADDSPDGVNTRQIEKIMRRVLEAERDKLHMGNPLGINDDIQTIIEEEVE